MQKPGSLEVARAKSATPEAVKNYFCELEKILNKYHLKEKPGFLFNIDEKGLSAEHAPPRLSTRPRQLKQERARQ